MHFLTIKLTSSKYCTKFIQRTKNPKNWKREVAQGPFLSHKAGPKSSKALRSNEGGCRGDVRPTHGSWGENSSESRGSRWARGDEHGLLLPHGRLGLLLVSLGKRLYQAHRCNTRHLLRKVVTEQSICLFLYNPTAPMKANTEYIQLMFAFYLCQPHTKPSGESNTTMNNWKRIPFRCIQYGSLSS